MASALQESAKRSSSAANQQDMQSATSRSAEDALPASTLSRLKLTEAKLREMIAQVRSVAALPDPLNHKLDEIELDDADPYTSQAREIPKSGLHLEKVSVPLGVLAVIFEARPDAVTQISSLCRGVKSGNAVILKPGRRSGAQAAQRPSCACCVLHSQARASPKTQFRSSARPRERLAELLAMHDLGRGYGDSTRLESRSSNTCRRTRAFRCSATPKASVISTSIAPQTRSLLCA